MPKVNINIIVLNLLIVLLLIFTSVFAGFLYNNNENSIENIDEQINGHTEDMIEDILIENLDHIVIEDAPGGSGTEIEYYSLMSGGDTGTEITVYAVGYDSEDNYLCEVPVLWKTSGSLDTKSILKPSPDFTFSSANANTVGQITADDGCGHSDSTDLIYVSEPVNVLSSRPKTPTHYQVAYRTHHAEPDSITPGTSLIIQTVPKQKYPYAQSHSSFSRASSLHHVNIEDAPGGNGSVVGDVLMTYDESLALYAVGYDASGNYVQDLNMSWGIHYGQTTQYVHGQTNYILQTGESRAGSECYISVSDMTKKYVFPYESNSTGTITITWPIPDPTIWGHIDILVDDEVYQGILTNLNRFVKDIETDPYKPYNVTVYNGSWSSEVDVRNLLINDYNNNNLTCTILMGDIITPWYEGDLGGGWENFPMDYYYMDLDSTWTDADSDGKYDAHFGNKGADIILGRLSPSSITALTGKNQSWLLNNYLDKNHKYRTSELSTNYSGLSYGETGMSDKWSKVYPKTLNVQYGNGTDYRKKISEGYESVWMNAHGMITAYNFANNTQIRDLDPPCLFFALHSCHCGYYVDPGNVATMHTFTNDFGLVTFASSQLMFSSYVPIKTQELELFNTMGDSADVRDYKGLMGMHTFGDPLLRISAPTWDKVVIKDEGFSTMNGANGNTIGNIVMKPGETLDLYAIGYDRFDEPVNNAYVSWSVTGSLDKIESGPSRWIRFSPTTDHTSGRIMVNDSYGHINYTGIITVNGTVLDHISIEDAPGGTGKAIDNITMTTDDELDMYAVGYTQNNSYISEFPINWNVTGNLDSSSSSSSCSFTFSPVTAKTTGTIIIKNVTGVINTTGTITVIPGARDHIIIENSAGGTGTEIATVDMTTDDTLILHAIGYDADDNYVDDIAVNWSVTGSLDTIPGGQSVSVSFTPKTAFTSGTIKADDGEGRSDTSGTITVNAGIITKIVIEDASGGTGTEIVDRVMFVSKTLKLYAVGRDAEDNYVNDITVKWTILGDIVGSLSSTNGPSTTLLTNAGGKCQIYAEHNTGIDDATGDITIIDNIKPEFGKDGSDSTAKAGNSYNFYIEVTDNIDIADVFVEYWFGDGNHKNLTITSSQEGKIYRSTIIIQSGSEDSLHYFFSAKDTWDNWNCTEPKTLEIEQVPVSVTRPEIEWISIPQEVKVDKQLTVMVKVYDESGVDGVFINYLDVNEIENNVTMTFSGDDTYTYNIPEQAKVGKLSLLAVAVNTKGIWNESEVRSISIIIPAMPGDTIPPFVLSTTPENNDVNVSIDIDVIIIFNEGMEINSAESAITITPEIDFRQSWSENDTALIMAFNENMSYNTTYYVTIGTGVTDSVGNPLALPYILKYITLENPAHDGGTDNTSIPPDVEKPEDPPELTPPLNGSDNEPDNGDKTIEPDSGEADPGPDDQNIVSDKSMDNSDDGRSQLDNFWFILIIIVIVEILIIMIVLRLKTVGEEARGERRETKEAEEAEEAEEEEEEE